MSDKAVTAATIQDSSGNTLILDQNAIKENGLIYVPNANALIKDGKVFVPAPTAFLDEASGNYYIPNTADPTKPIKLPEVVVDKTGAVFAQDSNSIVQLSATDLTTQIPYTPDPTAQ